MYSLSGIVSVCKKIQSVDLGIQILAISRHSNHNILVQARWSAPRELKGFGDGGVVLNINSLLRPTLKEIISHID